MFTYETGSTQTTTKLGWQGLSSHSSIKRGRNKTLFLQVRSGKRWLFFSLGDWCDSLLALVHCVFLSELSVTERKLQSSSHSLRLPAVALKTKNACCQNTNTSRCFFCVSDELWWVSVFLLFKYMLDIFLVSEASISVLGASDEKQPSSGFSKMWILQWTLPEERCVNSQFPPLYMETTLRQILSSCSRL